MFDADLIKKYIRDVPDYPKKGILFRDITTLLKEGNAFEMCISELASRLSGMSIDYVIGIEARGFIVGSALAYSLNKGFIPVRKKGKLPYGVISRDYALEYGNATIEIHNNAIEQGRRVVIADDLLATGGTAKAVEGLITELNGKISAFAFLVELSELKGRERLDGHEVVSLIKY